MKLHGVGNVAIYVEHGLDADVTPSTTIVVKEAIRVVRKIETSRSSILSQMQAFAKSLPEYFLIREMACVGDTLTPLVIAEIGDVRNFHSKHALIAYAGIDAPPYQSGGFNGTERHISKRGNGYLRHVGFEIMQCKLRLKPKGDPVYEFIQKKRSEGKCGKEAMVAGINKFLRIYYGKVTELYRELDAYEEASLLIGAKFSSVETLSFENGKEIFCHSIVTRVAPT
ncbi:MAG: IS110 family transposase [Ruminococcaceae bacterium]|nr:IS110 family transposase [Oscillospiraceae bacterium]